MKQQLVYIHGGMTFRRKKDYLRWIKTREIYLKKRVQWTDGFLQSALARKFEIIQPRMPLSDNARYSDWVIHFERYFPFLRDDITLLGVSLGGVFLAKYLSNNTLPVRIRKTCLVAVPFDNSLPGEDLVNGFVFRGDPLRARKNCKDIHFFFSPHDDVVSMDHYKKYAKKFSFAQFHIMNHIQDHFRMKKFPEIIKIIRSEK